MKKEESLTDAEKKLHEYGKIQVHNLEYGTTIQVLPTCTVTLDTLLEKNWDEYDNVGCFRNVLRIKTLKNGIPAHIVAKSPERSFDKDGSWWGGPRGNGGRVNIHKNPLVEGMTIWEAITLLELDRLGIPAEKPYAVITKPDGEKQLIVGQIGVGMEVGFTQGIKEGARSVLLQKSGLLPNDLQSLQVSKPAVYRMNKVHKLGDPDRTMITPPVYLDSYLIDVNRWSWPPYTDSMYERLKQLVEKVVYEWEKEHS